MTFKFLSKRVRSRALLSTLGLLLFLNCHAQSQERLANQVRGLRITNKTSSFEVFEIKAMGRDIRLKLKNSYERSIIDFKIGLPRPLGESGTVTDIVGDAKIIQPGATIEYGFTLPISYLDTPTDVQREREVVILTVLFDDWTSDGDTEIAAEMVAQRLGERIQVSRILPLLQVVLDLQDADLQKGLERLKAQVAALSCNPASESDAIQILSSKYESVFELTKDKLIGEIGTGLYFGQGKFLVRIRDLERQLSEKGGAPLREELTTVQKEYKKKLSAL
jgi:hypothetical protein